MNSDLVKYYHDRAAEYERIYSKPERQGDLQKATTILQELFVHKTVVEIACGTGYWTEKIAKTSRSIFATDINEAVIEIARKKEYSSPVTFECSSFSDIPADGKTESLFGGFIASHIYLQDFDDFLATINKLVLPGGTIVLMDNNYVEGSNHPIVQTDEHGNTFQLRELHDGTTHTVLKNFLTESFLEEKLSGIATDINFINLQYFWILSYKLAE